MKLAAVGAGYAGLASAVRFAELGHTVIGMDNDPRKLRAIQEGHSLIHEYRLPELVGG